MSPLFPPIAFSQTSVPCLRAAVIEAVNWLLGRLVLQLWFPDKFKYFPRLITHTLTFLSEKWFFRAVVSSPQQPWSKAKISIIFLLFGPHKPDDKAFLLAGFCESQKAPDRSCEGFCHFLPFSLRISPPASTSPYSNDLQLRPPIYQRHCCSPACHHPPHPPVPTVALLSQTPAEALLGRSATAGAKQRQSKLPTSLLNALALLWPELLGAHLLMQKKMMAFM